MSRAALSLAVFGAYILVLGASLILFPDFILGLFGMPIVRDVWIRVVGMLLMLLAVYDILAARAEWRDFLRWSVYTRGSVIVFFSAFVATGLAPPVLLLFGTIDFSAAVWTGLALRADARGTSGGV
jgi:hypothetical protein